MSPELRELLIPSMPWWQLVLRSAVVYMGLLVMVRASGKRTIAQFTAFDLVVILLIAGAVRRAMMGDDQSLTGAALAVGTLVGLNYLIATASSRSARVDQLVEGEPVALARDGVLYEARLVANRVPRKDFDEALRKHGVADLDEVKLATLEVNGEITVVKR